MDTWNVWVLDDGSWQLYLSAVPEMVGQALGLETGLRFELVRADLCN